MQIFGLEIRKAGDINTLYENVDSVLSKINMDDMKKLSVAHALQKMLSTERHFNICAIRDCAKVTQTIIDDERMRIYQTQHCINWNEMLPEFRQNLVAMVLDDFRHVLRAKNSA